MISPEGRAPHGIPQARPLGHEVSSVGLGSWLTYGGSVSEQTAKDCVWRAYDLGVNFFDTANSYARGRAEEIVGKALADFPRDSYALATKVFFDMGEGPNDGGLSRKHVFEQVHHSLRRLGVEYIDLYQCHRYDEETPLEETCQDMDDLVSTGKILYWGVSEWNADQLAHVVNLCGANGWAVPVSNQPQYSALWRRVEERLLPTCLEYGLGNVVFSPLAMGILTGKYVSVDAFPRAPGPLGRPSSSCSGTSPRKCSTRCSGFGRSLRRRAAAWPSSPSRGASPKTRSRA